jgi:hypothetical protein
MKAPSFRSFAARITGGKSGFILAACPCSGLDQGRKSAFNGSTHMQHRLSQPMSNRFLSPQDLEKIADLTLEDYNQHAESYWRGTHDHDVSQNIDALLKHITADQPGDRA